MSNAVSSLKIVEFSATAPGDVVYYVEGDQCVFCGFSNMSTSTINAAEAIILAIAKQENIDPKSLTFYDLQTYKTFSDKEPGEFELDIIDFNIYDGKVEDLGWTSFPDCPAWVLKLFAEHIGPNPYQQKNPRDKRSVDGQVTDSTSKMEQVTP